MTKYAVVQQETCIGCGNCEGIAPDIFNLDEDGLAFVAIDQNQGSAPIPEGKGDVLAEAAEECPTDSIKVSDRPLDKQE